MSELKRYTADEIWSNQEYGGSLPRDSEFVLATDIPRPNDAKICRIRTDNDGHNYLIPKERVEMFEKSLSEISQYTESTDSWYDAIADFEEDFRQYRIDGIEDLDILCKQSEGSNEV